MSISYQNPTRFFCVCVFIIFQASPVTDFEVGVQSYRSCTEFNNDRVCPFL